MMNQVVAAIQKQSIGEEKALVNPPAALWRGGRCGRASGRLRKTLARRPAASVEAQLTCRKSPA
jgi:hypothetical protein